MIEQIHRIYETAKDARSSKTRTELDTKISLIQKDIMYIFKNWNCSEISLQEFTELKNVINRKDLEIEQLKKDLETYQNVVNEIS